MRHAAQTVVLTGVGRVGQVGEFVARRFAEHGAALVTLDRDAAEGEARAARLREAGFRACAYACDLTSQSEVEAVAARIVEQASGRVHALVNIAGGFDMTGDIAGSDPVKWERQFAINHTTAYLATRSMLPALRAARGAVVYFGSAAALPGGTTKGMTAYAASKGAVLTLMRSVAEQEAVNGVRANAVAPGTIRTAANEESMGPNAPYVEREDVAEAVLFLCSPLASAVSGQVLELKRTRR